MDGWTIKMTNIGRLMLYRQSNQHITMGIDRTQHACYKLWDSVFVCLFDCLFSCLYCL